MKKAEKNYPEYINLPFNNSSIIDRFIKKFPADTQPEESGFNVIIQGGSVVYDTQNSTLLIPDDEITEELKPQTEPLFAGLWDGKKVLGRHISTKVELPPRYSAQNFNANSDILDTASLTLAAYIKQVIDNDRLLLYCSKCSSKTERMIGSFGRRCTSCKTEHFPHIHPCAIILVKKDDEVLLVRKREWAIGRYGLVAGFLDMGESLEECAYREVKEETGISVKNIRYLTSQSWPFPAQIMAGFVADYDYGEIVVDKDELEDARWFKNDNIPALPGKRSIARWIIDNYSN